LPTEPSSIRVVPVADPLTVFVDAHRRGLPPSRGDKRFNAGEHAWLASQGAERAMKTVRERARIRLDVDLFSAIPRRDGRERLQYGELVALSGDFYETPDALFEEQPSPLPWLWQSNDLSDLRAIFDDELRWIEDRLNGRGGASPYPSDNIRLAWNAKSYVELALRNFDHFGWHNLCAYCKHHERAMELAASTNGRQNEDFRRALYINAFADHFLTDGFAAGHVRVPRVEICDWAAEQGHSDKVAGALSKLLHDQDGHARSLHAQQENIDCRESQDGLWVQNARGEAWYTYCDGQLFLEGAERSPAVERAVSAVEASVTEFLLAWQRRDLPRGVYAATEWVPFPHPGAQLLTEKFASDMPDSDLERLWSSIAWYAKVPWIAGIERHHLRSFLAALPQMMGRFREYIAAAAEHPEISSRIDARYIEAYRGIA